MKKGQDKNIRVSGDLGKTGYETVPFLVHKWRQRNIHLKKKNHTVYSEHIWGNTFCLHMKFQKFLQKFNSNNPACLWVLLSAWPVLPSCSSNILFILLAVDGKDWLPPHLILPFWQWDAQVEMLHHRCYPCEQSRKTTKCVFRMVLLISACHCNVCPPQNSTALSTPVWFMIH